MDATNLPCSAPLAVLPGLLCDSRLFAGQVGRFADAMVVDGFYEGARSLGAMADHALERLPAKFSLLGHSMGARVALEVLRRAPERVERLALSSTGVHPVQPGEAEKRHALRAIGARDGMAALVDAWLLPMIAPERRDDAALVEPLRAMCLDAGLATYEAQIEALLSRPGVDDLLPTIACPTLVVCGSLDQWSPPDQHEAIAAAIPGAVLRIVPGAGHMLPAESPDPFNALLLDWLAITPS